MSFVPKTSDSTLWILLGTLVAALIGLAWRSRRERSRTDFAPAKSPQAAVGAPPADAAEHGWSQRPQ
jgi:hypothetical protein